MPFTAGSVTGSLEGMPTFQFETAFDRVTIENHSGRDLQVGVIDVLARNTPRVAVQRLDQSGFSATLTTHTNQTDVRIENRPNTGAVLNDILLTGRIDNPVGTTRVLNAGADILASGGQSIETRRLELRSAGGRIGTAPNRIQAGLVKTADLATPSIEVAAWSDVFLALNGILRDARPNAELIVNVISIVS